MSAAFSLRLRRVNPVSVVSRRGQIVPNVFDPRSGADRRTPAESIRFYELQRPTCPYKELGHVTANSSFFGSWDKVQRRARERAHELGGDAIVSVREQSRFTGAVFSKSQISATETTSLSGTVIRFTNPGCRD